jgi:hypothetical protein
MANDIFKWICNISALNDEQLKQEIHQKLLPEHLPKSDVPKVDTHTLRNEALTEHDFADTPSICFF